LPLYGDIDDCDKIASGRYIQRKIEDITDQTANIRPQTIKPKPLSRQEGESVWEYSRADAYEKN